MSVFSGPFAGGGGLNPLLRISAASVAVGATGVVAQLLSPLPGATFDEFADVAGVAIAADGAVSIATPLAAGASRTVNARVSGTLFLASVVVTAAFVLTGVDIAAPPAFTPSFDLSDARNAGFAALIL